MQRLSIQSPPLNWIEDNIIGNVMILNSAVIKQYTKKVFRITAWPRVI